MKPLYKSNAHLQALLLIPSSHNGQVLARFLVTFPVILLLSLL